MADDKKSSEEVLERVMNHTQPPSVETMTQTLAEVLDPREVLQNALTTTARKTTLRLQHEWPWATALADAFVRLRSLPLTI